MYVFLTTLWVPWEQGSYYVHSVPLAPSTIAVIYQVLSTFYFWLCFFVSEWEMRFRCFWCVAAKYFPSSLKDLFACVYTEEAFAVAEGVVGRWKRCRCGGDSVVPSWASFGDWALWLDALQCIFKHQMARSSTETGWGPPFSLLLIA